MPTRPLAIPLGIALLFVACNASGADSPAAQPEKHVLYLGLEVGLTLEDSTSPVVDADNVSVDIEHNDQRLRVPLRLAGQFKAAVVPRVGKSTVRIENLRTEKRFSRGNDPHQQAAQQQMLLTSAAEHRQEVAMRRYLTRLQEIDAVNIAHGATVAVAAANPGFSVTTSFNDGMGDPELEAALDGVDTAFGAPMDGSQRGGEGLRTHNDDKVYDALAISFTVSSPQPIANAYGIIRAFYRDPEKQNEPEASLRFFGLPNLGPDPRRIYLHAEGLPPGFQLDRYEIHIYSNGRELATNTSNNRVELTLEEIHQFLILKHQTESRHGSAAVAIAVELLDNDLRALVPPDQHNRAVDVTVDANGRATKIELENTGWNMADAYLTTVLRETRYLPAMQNGRPVGGSARFVLSEFMP